MTLNVAMAAILCWFTYFDARHLWGSWTRATDD